MSHFQVLKVCISKFKIKEVIQFLLLIISFSNFATAQIPPSFKQINNIDVKIDGQNLPNAWAGGLNNPQFSNIDLNNDDAQDLFIFDKSTNYVSTFLHENSSNSIDYTFYPQYAAQFPSNLHDWVLLVDYNADGLPDIFTYGIGGISVYKSQRITGDSLAFELVNEQLKYEGFSGKVNVYVSSIDIPAIVDVNQDGDVDVLTFDILGGYVEYYENQTKELGLPADSLQFLKESDCWGQFLEAGNSPTLELYSDCNLAVNNQKVHAGSTLLAWDTDGDNDQDLLLGDVAYNQIVHLINGGTIAEAQIIEQQFPFPKNTLAVDIQSFPAIFRADVDNDGRADLLLSPNDKRSQSSEHIWRYKNVGTAEIPSFEFQNNDFLVNEMLDVGVGAYPAFADYNSDGLLDLFIGNYGHFLPLKDTYQAQLALFENVGTAQQPAFQLITDDFYNLSSLSLSGIYPTFGDVDKDGDLDMITGDETGALHLFTNEAAPNEVMQLELSQFHFLTLNSGSTAVPHLHDVDNNGLLDLIVGKKSGSLSYFENVSTIPSEPSFELISDFWGEVDVRKNGFPTGYSVPFIAALDSRNDEKKYLMVNNQFGNISVYTDLEADAFTLLSNDYSNIRTGGRGGLALNDLNQDGNLELLVGNRAGGVQLFSQENPSTTVDNFVDKSAFFAYPNPVHNIMHISTEVIHMPSMLVIKFFDLQGKCLYTKRFGQYHSSIALKLDFLHSGIYLCEITTDNQIFTQKIVRY